HRPDVRDHGAGWHGQHRRHAGRGPDHRAGREPDGHLLRALVVAGGLVRHPADRARRAPGGPVRTLMPLPPGGSMRRTGAALVVGLVVVVAGIVLAKLRVNPYLSFAGYVILEYVVIATAWNILGGYAGYVNFGTPAFFALGAYSSVFLIKTIQPPLPVLIL